MKTHADKVEIPLEVLKSVDTLEELEDWLMAHNPRVMRELRQARREDVSGKFKPWKPRLRGDEAAASAAQARHLPWPTKSK